MSHSLVCCIYVTMSLSKDSIDFVLTKLALYVHLLLLKGVFEDKVREGFVEILEYGALMGYLACF